MSGANWSVGGEQVTRIVIRVGCLVIQPGAAGAEPSTVTARKRTA